MLAKRDVIDKGGTKEGSSAYMMTDEQTRTFSHSSTPVTPRQEPLVDEALWEIVGKTGDCTDGVLDIVWPPTSTAAR